MPPHPIGLGIIGFGRIGAEHAAWIAQAQGIRPVAVADETPARRQLAESRGLTAHATVDQLLADPRVDAVLVATPTAMHFPHATRALAAGKHLMVEKPITLDLPTARQLVTEAKNRNVVLSVFHNRRWDLDYLTLKRAIDANHFGQLFNVESRLGQWASCVGPAAREYRPQWRNEASFGGGGLYDWGSHFVDQLWRLLHPAKPLRVFAQLRGNVWTRDCDDLARLLIDFDSGACGLVEINTTTTRPLPRWHVDGSTGSADAPHSPTFDLHTWSTFHFTPAPNSNNPIPTTEPLPISPLGLTEPQIWTQFARAITHNEPPAVPAPTVLPTMALLDAARTSAREGRAVDVRDQVDWLL